MLIKQTMCYESTTQINSKESISMAKSSGQHDTKQAVMKMDLKIRIATPDSWKL